jgi:hypothetical protein
LRSFGSNVARKPWIAKLHHFAAYLDNPAKALCLHDRKQLLEQQQGGLYEELKLIQIRGPGLLFDREQRLRPGGVEHSDIDRPQRGIYGLDQLRDVILPPHVGRKRFRCSTSLSNILTDTLRSIATLKIVDGNLYSRCCQFCRDGCA